MTTVYPACKRNPDTELIDAIDRVAKQCGTCKWWNEEITDNPFMINEGSCKHPIPESFKGVIKVMVLNAHGQDCPVYEERKE